jgi:hypothetical protein
MLWNIDDCKSGIKDNVKIDLQVMVVSIGSGLNCHQMGMDISNMDETKEGR